jgi:hypothetical protein
VLTIVSTCKPFEGRSAIVQRNAITSWTLLDPRPEVILFGDEPGASAISAELGFRHVPDVARNEFGTPLVSDLLGQAQRLAQGDAVCYVNGDIILMNDFMEATFKLLSWRRNSQFLAIGTRWNVWVHDPIDFSRDWTKQLRQSVAETGEPGGPWTMDYFIFSPNLYPSVPRFAIGRPYWDDWMVYAAWKARVPIVDVTRAVTVVHQRHDYGHYAGGQMGLYAGEESHRNRALAGRLGVGVDFGLRDATHVMSDDGIQSAWRERGLRQWALQRFRQRVVVLQAVHPAIRSLVKVGRTLDHRLRRSKGPIGWSWPAPPSVSSAQTDDPVRSPSAEERARRSTDQ